MLRPRTASGHRLTSARLELGSAYFLKADIAAVLAEVGNGPQADLLVRPSWRHPTAAHRGGPPSLAARLNIRFQLSADSGVPLPSAFKCGEIRRSFELAKRQQF
jgi:hypothetical protein